MGLKIKDTSTGRAGKALKGLYLNAANETGLSSDCGMHRHTVQKTLATGTAPRPMAPLKPEC